jgi:AbrB family looped-hinge helix DNA binding protein
VASATRVTERDRRGLQPYRTLPDGVRRKFEVMSHRPLSASMRNKGVVTIPQAVREQLHLKAGDNLLITVKDG